ncbi:MAG: disulfide bond formation protein B [Nevskiaceae bacterium]|jgi:disulfide bond formation protein DsbB|nr:MAG: disulfide bond formation protein B [Nevskiaceae bacterium]TAM26846.1 MAG: disulfide bond formation protein B [Nevskiaceae bacterium]
MKALLSYRGLSFLGFAGCASGLLMAIFFFQKFLGLEPCPMCIFQRVAMLSAGLVFLVAALHGPKAWGRWVYSGLAALASAIGAGIAWRHVWLQGLPEDQRPACGPTLSYLMDMMPLQEVVTTILKGDGNCAKIDWTFLGQSLPFWTLVVFVALIAWALLTPWFARR